MHFFVMGRIGQYRLAMSVPLVSIEMTEALNVVRGAGNIEFATSAVNLVQAVRTLRDGNRRDLLNSMCLLVGVDCSQVSKYSLHLVYLFSRKYQTSITNLLSRITTDNSRAYLIG